MNSKGTNAVMADNKTAQEYAMQRAREKRAQDYFDMFKENEGYKTKVYKDTKGKRTIGIGFNLEDGGNRKFLKKIGIDVNELFAGRELNDEEIRTLYNHSLTQAFRDAKSLTRSSTNALSQSRKQSLTWRLTLALQS
jgi:GH24 family phage-related lysozyme (muramidase)